MEMSLYSEDDSTCHLNENGCKSGLEKTEERYYCHPYRFRSSTTAIRDETDRLPKNPTFKWYDGLGLVYSAIMYLVDTGSDIAVAYVLYDSDKMLYFYLTLAFIIIPTITMTIFSLRWYIVDASVPASPPTSPLIWVIRVIFLLLQLGPALRYIDSLKFGIKYIRRKDKSNEERHRFYEWMSYEDADAALLRLFESFLEAAPQLLLQIYILASPDSPSDPNIVLVQQVSCAISLCSLAWALASQQRAMRISLPGAKNISWPGTIVQCLWFLFTIGSRMLTLGLFASLFPIHLAGICAFRWIVMTIWLMTMKTEFCDSKLEEFFYHCVLGVVFIFCYFNPENSPTKWRYFFFYMYTLTENTILIAVWFTWVDPDLWYKLPAILAVFLAFLVGLIFMAIYYCVLHPTIGAKNVVGEEPVTPDIPMDELIEQPYSNGEPSPMRELKVDQLKDKGAAQGQTFAHSPNNNQTNRGDNLNVYADVHTNGAYGTPV